jgi:hypothetical protein
MNASIGNISPSKKLTKKLSNPKKNKNLDDS